MTSRRRSRGERRSPLGFAPFYGRCVRVGLALGGGGLTGTAFHAGVLTALAAHFDARDAEIIVGTSAGSTAAALMRKGFPPSDYVPRVLGEPLSAEGEAILGQMPPLSEPLPPAARSRRPASPELLRAIARRPWAFRPGVTASALLPLGSRPVDPGVARFRAMFDTWPAQAMWLVAVDVDTGQRVVFGRDATASVGDAVSASCAVPGYFAPVVINGRRYVDGGAYSLVSLDLLAEERLDVVIVSAPLSTTSWIARELGNAPRIVARMQLEREARMVRAAGIRVLIVAPDAPLRALMGNNSMVAAKRAPVAVATRDYARRLFDAQL